MLKTEEGGIALLKLSAIYKKYLIRTILLGLGIISFLCFIYYSVFYLFNYAQNSDKPIFLLLFGIIVIIFVFAMEITSEYNKIKIVSECSKGKKLKRLLREIDSGIDFIQSMIDDSIEAKEKLSESELSLQEKQELVFGLISQHEVNKNDLEDMKRGVQDFIDTQTEVVNTLKKVKLKLNNGEGLSQLEIHALWENCIFDD